MTNAKKYEEDFGEKIEPLWNDCQDEHYDCKNCQDKWCCKHWLDAPWEAPRRTIMSIEAIIQGLQFTVDMFLLDPLTGETITEPRNDMDKTTIDSCKEAIKILKQIEQ